jgi:hypothetical protein
MVRTQNTLLKGWPETTPILGRRKRLLGYRVRCRFNTPLGLKILKFSQLPLWAGAFYLAMRMTAGLPKEESGGLLVWAAMLGVAGEFFLYRLLQGHLELELRPQVIRWRRRGKWLEYETPHAIVAIYPHDKAMAEQLREQKKIMDAQYSQTREKPMLPGHFYRQSWTVSLNVRLQRIDLANVYGERKAKDLFNRLGALLVDIDNRQWGQKD